MAKIGRGSEQAMIRLPDGMRDRLKEEAKKNGRSMNAEIVARLEATFYDPTGHSATEALNSVIAANYINATKIAAILREALERVESLPLGDVRVEDMEGYSPDGSQ
ncbi:Arc family DNA-binding protein [Mycoplana dimorpha]|uniref:Arc-like DNA binding dprotein n=1 Tax=Mycoplana dimorpha TaxID=28320 RepID=A0A2T5BBX4_MYCDI|nr:Arc family DNA-binding protein [Mycoplana dimorpha]PTM96485.1 Arc-like DNA binding dprotein [Mycoplana dimorpha]